jgi:hypothetical protein
LRIFSRTIALLTLTVLTLAFFSACGGGSESDDDATSSAPEVIEVPTRWASGNANDLATLVDTSDEVFTARVERLAGTREEGFLGGTGESAGGKRGSTFPITSYDITITRSFVGDRAVGSAATLEQPGGISSDTGARMMLENDPPVEVGKEYLFFATVTDAGALTTAPFGRLEVGPGKLTPVGPWGELGALKQLANVSADNLGGEIHAAAQ